MATRQEAFPNVFIPEICLIVLEMIGGKESLLMRSVSQSWHEASQHIRIRLEFTEPCPRFFHVIDHVMMEHVDDLYLSNSKLKEKDYERMSKVEHLKNLKSLHFEHEFSVAYLFGEDDDENDGNDADYQIGVGISLISNSPVFSNLEKLTVINHDIGNDGLDSIFNSSVLTKLKSLELEANGIDSFGQITSKTNKLTNLTELTLKSESLSCQDIELMSNNQLFSNLKRFYYDGDSSGFLHLILTSTVWTRLTELILPICYIDKSVSTIQSTLNLECLKLVGTTVENCTALINNKSICGQSLKELDVGHIHTNQSHELEKLGNQFECFTFQTNYYVDDGDPDVSLFD